jgi:DNA-binding beta-propeller fold protein YncE
MSPNVVELNNSVRPRRAPVGVAVSPNGSTYVTNVLGNSVSVISFVPTDASRLTLTTR